MFAIVLLAVTARAAFNFVSIGDWGCVPIGGQRRENELVVARQFSAAATALDARFVLNVGDSFYYCGVHNVTDAVFKTTFEDVFTEPSTTVPWWGCMGNHDYGYPGSVESQLQYRSPKNDRWKIPARYYYKRLVFSEVNISLLVLDAPPCQKPYRSSNPEGWDPCGSRIPSCPGCAFHENIIKQSCSAQMTWLKAILPQIPAADWRIVMTHAPAGEVDVEDFLTPLQHWGFDLFINGHIHLLTHYTMDGNGTYVTTGAGCMVDVPRESDPEFGASSCQYHNPLHPCKVVWEETVAGYTAHSFSADFNALYTHFYNSEGKLLHTASTTKRGAPPPGPPAPTGPSPPSPSTPGPSPPGRCCYYRDAECTAGEVCCDDRGKSYDKWTCDGTNGKLHDCVWTGKECVVG